MEYIETNVTFEFWDKIIFMMTFYVVLYILYNLTENSIDITEKNNFLQSISTKMFRKFTDYKFNSIFASKKPLNYYYCFYL